MHQARLGARLARAVVQSAHELIESTQDKIAGHRLGTALLRPGEILPRKPFKAVARVQIPLGPPDDRSEAASACSQPAFLASFCVAHLGQG